MVLRFFSCLMVLLLVSVAQAEEPMNNAVMEGLVKKHLDSVQGQSGQWRGEFSGVAVMVMTDESHDRMRVMTPIMEVGDEPDVAELQRCMQANFASALDGRYAIFNGVLWAVYVHPLSEFRASRFESVVRQVTNLAVTHGTTYSSGELQFQPEGPRKKPEGPPTDDSVGLRKPE